MVTYFFAFTLVVLLYYISMYISLQNNALEYLTTVVVHGGMFVNMVLWIFGKVFMIKLN